MASFFYFFLFLFYFSCTDSAEIKELEIDADRFTHDKKKKRFYATGNVEIISDSFKIFAQKIFINTETKVISARDKIRVFHESGTILKTDRMTSDKKMENAKFSKSFLYLPDDSKEEYIINKRFMRIAANSMERRNKDWEAFNQAVFTACDICYDKKKKKYKEPLIQLKANKVIHDKKKLTMEYYDSFLELSGRTILYLPYFSHPSPQVKRKSGFLVPKYRSSSSLGESFEIPYYYVLSDYEDLTFSPKLSTEKNPVGFVQHRKNLSNGKLFTEFSATISDKNINQIKSNKFRGHIESRGQFEVNNYLNWEYSINRASDRNYLQTYRYKYRDVLDSNIKISAVIKNNFYSLESYFFQDMRKNFDQKETPKIFPRIKTSLNSSNFYNNLSYSTNIEYFNLFRKEGANVNKFFLEQSLKFPILSKSGSIVEFGGHINSALYKISDYEDPILKYKKDDYYKGKLYPQLTIKYSKPLYKDNKISKQILNPKILLVTGSNEGNSLKIPNEDSRNFDLDYIDLFQRNRLSGTDRLDNGTRIDYGFSYTNQNKKNLSVTNINIGQSYRLNKEAYQSSNSGSNNNFSNIVSSLNIKPNNNLNFNSYLSWDSYNRSFSQMINELSIGNNEHRIYANHLYSKATEGIESTSFERRNQVRLGINNKLSKYWTFLGSTEFKIVDELKFMDWNTKFKYEDECLGFSLSWKRQYTYNSESPTSNNFLFLFSLKKIMESEI